MPKVETRCCATCRLAYLQINKIKQPVLYLYCLWWGNSSGLPYSQLQACHGWRAGPGVWENEGGGRYEPAGLLKKDPTDGQDRDAVLRSVRM